MRRTLWLKIKSSVASNVLYVLRQAFEVDVIMFQKTMIPYSFEGIEGTARDVLMQYETISPLSAAPVYCGKVTVAWPCPLLFVSVSAAIRYGMACNK